MRVRECLQRQRDENWSDVVSYHKNLGDAELHDNDHARETKVTPMLGESEEGFHGDEGPGQGRLLEEHIRSRVDEYGTRSSSGERSLTKEDEDGCGGKVFATKMVKRSIPICAKDFSQDDPSRDTGDCLDSVENANAVRDLLGDEDKDDELEESADTYDERDVEECLSTPFALPTLDVQRPGRIGDEETFQGEEDGDDAISISSERSLTDDDDVTYEAMVFVKRIVKDCTSVSDTDRLHETNDSNANDVTDCVEGVCATGGAFNLEKGMESPVSKDEVHQGDSEGDSSNHAVVEIACHERDEDGPFPNPSASMNSGDRRVGQVAGAIAAVTVCATGPVLGVPTTIRSSVKREQVLVHSVGTVTGGEEGRCVRNAWNHLTDSSNACDNQSLRSCDGDGKETDDPTSEMASRRNACVLSKMKGMKRCEAPRSALGVSRKDLNVTKNNPRERGGHAENSDITGSSRHSVCVLMGNDTCGRMKAVSKALAHILRHKAVDFNIAIRPDGFCKLNEVLGCRKMRKLGATQELVEQAVRTNAKRRFEIRGLDGRLMIRALQGHSTKEVRDDRLLRTLELSDELPRKCVHGT